MFDVEASAETFRSVFSVLTPIAGEVKLKADAEGWKIRAVDPAHVAMVDLELSRGAFDKYEIEPLELGLNVERLLESMKSARGEEMVRMFLDDDNRLVISMDNLTLKIPLVDPSGFSEPKVPSLQLPVKLRLNSAELQKGLKISASISDYLTFNCEEDKLVMTSSEDLSSMTLELKKDKEYQLESYDKPSKSSFSLDYFTHLMKGVGANRDLEIHLGNSYPLKMVFDFADENGHAVYLLAPRIESS